MRGDAVCFFERKTAYRMRISDWSSDVCSSDLPAALKTNVPQLKPGGLIIADEGEFNDRNLAKAKYDANPLDDGSLAKWQLLKLNISQNTEERRVGKECVMTCRSRCSPNL